jgi:membrane protease YdiL (CAAX protease family)
MTAEQLKGIVAALQLAVFATSAAVWFHAIQRLRSGRGLIPFEPRRQVPWDGAWVLFSILLYWCLAALVNIGAARTHMAGLPEGERAAALANPAAVLGASPAFMLRMIQADSAAKLIAMCLVLFVLSKVKRADEYDFGIGFERIGTRIAQGAYVFFLALPPTLLLQFVMVEIVGIKYDHALIEAVRSPTGGALVLWSGIAAVVVAPLVEEFVFRGIVQGWLERISAEVQAREDDERLLRLQEETAERPSISASPESRRLSGMPILFSSAIFALVHLPQWAAIGPLFIFGVGLGYLYRQTHSIWPGVVMHFLLNGLTMTVLLLGAKP